MPGSTPISVPSSDADERVEQIDRRQRDAEAEGEVAEQIHRSARPSAERRGQIGDCSLSPITNTPTASDASRTPLISASFDRNSWLAALAMHDQQDRRQHEARRD